MSQTVSEAASASFTVVATGKPLPDFQWLQGEEALPGRTDARLNLSDLTAAAAGVYRVVVSNAAGSVTSDPATLTVVPLALHLGYELLADGRFRVRLTGPVGVTYQLQSTTDLVKWEPLLTGGAGEGVLEYTTPKPVPAGTRHFRGFVP